MSLNDSLDEEKRKEKLRLIEGWVVLALVEHGYLATYEWDVGWVMEGHGHTLRPDDLVTQTDAGDLSVLRRTGYSA